MTHFGQINLLTIDESSLQHTLSYPNESRLCMMARVTEEKALELGGQLQRKGSRPRRKEEKQPELVTEHIQRKQLFKANCSLVDCFIFICFLHTFCANSQVFKGLGCTMLVNDNGISCAYLLRYGLVRSRKTAINGRF